MRSKLRLQLISKIGCGLKPEISLERFPLQIIIFSRLFFTIGRMSRLEVFFAAAVSLRSLELDFLL